MSSRKPCALEAQHAQQAAPERLLRHRAGRRCVDWRGGYGRRTGSGCRRGRPRRGSRCSRARAGCTPMPAISLVGGRHQRRPVPMPARPSRRRAPGAAARRGRPARRRSARTARTSWCELAEHEVAAVAAEIAPVRSIQALGGRISAAAIEGGVEQRPLGEQAVLVAVAEQHLAQRQDVAEVEPLAAVERQLAVPVDLRLADAVGEAERLDRRRCRWCRQPRHELRRPGPSPAGDLAAPRPRAAPACANSITTRCGTLGFAAAPLPAPRVRWRRCRQGGVSGWASAAMPARNSSENCGDHGVRHAQAAQALAGERDLQRRVGRRRHGDCGGDRGRPQPRACRLAIGDVARAGSRRPRAGRGRSGRGPGCRRSRPRSACAMPACPRGARGGSARPWSRPGLGADRSTPWRISVLRLRSATDRPG